MNKKEKEVKKQNFVPILDRVAIKRIDEEKIGEIFVVSAKGNRPEKGTVVAVGPGCRDKAGNIIPMGVSVGDIVYFAKMGYVEVAIEKDKYVIIREGDILGRLE